MSTKKTALYDCHKSLNASMVEFADTMLPVRYQSEKQEHLAVRTCAGIFDVSHMGEFEISGPGAIEFLQEILSNNAENLQVGQAHYTLLLNQHGGIVDDLILYRLDKTKFMLCVNAANIDIDWDFILEQKTNFAVEIKNISDDFSQIALQGPKALEIFRASSSSPAPARYRFSQAEFPGFSAMVAHTGYTGEEGVEIFVKNQHAQDLWCLLLENGQELGLQPCGLAARDSLRLEAGMPLHGQDIDENTTPLEAKLMFAVDLDKHNFSGKDALVKQRALGIKRKLVGFRMLDRGICRHGFEVKDLDENTIGQVSSGSWPPNHETSIGLAYVKSELSKPGTEIFIDVRGQLKKAQVVKPRFIQK